MSTTWRLATLDATTTYVLRVAPNQMDPPLPQQGVVLHGAGIDGQFRGARHDQAVSWVASGVLLDRAQYDALAAWVASTGRCHLYDHLGRRFLVRVTAFRPVRAPRHRHPWRHTYQLAITTYAVAVTDAFGLPYLQEWT